MCIILSVNHISCSHTTAIWQHCIKATPSQLQGKKSCINVRQHERPILTRKLCEDCSGQRLFARRGGVAERGHGILTAIPEASTKIEGDEANDSGYHSDIIPEEDESSDLSERSLSPKTIAPPRAQSKMGRPRKRNSSSQRSLNRKPSWRPNLKRDLSLEEAAPSSSPRGSIDSILSCLDDNIRNTVNVQPSIMQTTPSPTSSPSPPTYRHAEPRRGRTSTLLHPSPPEPVEMTGQAQVAVAFSSPQIVQVRRPTSLQVAPRPRKKSTLLHPSSPVHDDDVETHPPSHNKNRRPSSLLHPSPSAPACTTTFPKTVVSVPPHAPSPSHNKNRRPSSLLHPSPSAPATTTVFPRTIISVPPQHAPRPKPGRTSSLLEQAPRMPLLKTAVSEPVSETMRRVRRESVLHSCLSDGEEEGGR